MKKTLLMMTIFGLFLSTATFIVSCTRSGRHEKDPNLSHYTCPMHPQIHQDHPGDCPICHMKLVPVYRDAKEGSGSKTKNEGVRISPDRQQLIGVKTAKAERKNAIREIRTTGRVAFDPELAVAQREYREISKNVPSLREAAKSNLRLKGMSEEEIDALNLKKSAHSTNLYLPGPEDPQWIYATLFQAEMDAVKPGDVALVTLPFDPAMVWKGTVTSIDPVVDANSRTVRARISVPAGNFPLRPDTFVDVTLKSNIGEELVVPSSAVLDTGERTVIFVRSEDRFQSREVSLGPKLGDVTVIRSGVEEGEEVVSGAAFLVDSEAQLKAAIP